MRIPLKISLPFFKLSLLFFKLHAHPVQTLLTLVSVGAWLRSEDKEGNGRKIRSPFISLRSWMSANMVPIHFIQLIKLLFIMEMWRQYSPFR